MYRTVAQLDSLTSLLAGWFPGYFQRYRLPEDSVEGRPVHALRLRAGTATNRRGVLLIGGTHSRELMNPDALAELAVDMLVSHINGTDISYGGFTMPAATVKAIMESMDVWFVPCINPDGRHYVMTVDDLWRKNRRDNPSTACDGVDLNRNCDFVWGVAQGQTSCSPCSDVYCGPSAFSEPETRNVKHLLDNHRMVTFVDVHSYSELVLWPWGHAPIQSHDPSQRFTGLPTGTCTASIPRGYAEYLDPRDHQRFSTVGATIVDAIGQVRGRSYVSKPSLDLYATTGTFDDYAYSRHIADPALGKTYGFTFETGPWTGDARTSFHPSDPEPIKRDTKAGLLTLMQQSICAVDFIGLKVGSARTGVEVARAIRDRRLAASATGRDLIRRFEEVSPALGAAVAARPRFAKRVGKLLRRLAELADDPGARLTDDDVQQLAAVLERVRHRDTDLQRVARDASSATIPHLAGKTLDEAIDLLSQGHAAGTA
jgi:hypothetical protein